MTLAPILSLCAATLGVTLTLVALRVARAPGWVELRWFALVSATTAVYAAGNVASTTGLPDGVVLLAARAQLAAVLLESWAWLHLADHAGGRDPTARQRRWRLALPAAAALALLPGVAYDGSVVSHDFAPWGTTYRDAVPTALGAALFVGGLVGAAVVVVRFAARWGQGERHERVSALCIATLFLLGVNDGLAGVGLIATPYLLDVGFALPLAALAWSFADRFVADARALQELRLQLEGAVAARTADLAATQQALHQSERLAALGQFAAGVAHQVNNPAAVVTASLSYLSDGTGRGALPSDAGEVLDEAREAMARITGLVRQLVDAGRLAGGAAPGGHAEVAKVAALVLSEQRGPAGARVRLSARVPDELAVRARPEALHRLLGALVANALQAIPQGRAGAVELVALPAEGDRVAIEVTDDGVGMPAEVLRRAFDPFFTTRAEGEGIGLGLSVARALAQGLGGTLVLESHPGAGTRARLLLPAAAAAPPGAGDGPPPA